LDALKKTEKLREILSQTSSVDADAAVCLLLRVVDQALTVLLVRRAENPTDPWSGQIALPGGKRSQQDQTLKQTVIREVLEETGITLSDHRQFLGVLPISTSVSGPKLRVLPFIFSIDYEPSVSLNSELQDFFWIQIDKLGEHRQAVDLAFGQLPAFVIKDNIIWGLTYRILESLLEAIDLLSR
jgi:8-oxo-dGTP diphosphatase